MFTVITKRKSYKSHIQTYYAPMKQWDRKREIFLFLMFLTGLICGAFAVRTSDSLILDRLFALLRNYMDVKAQQPFLINLSNICLKRILVLLFLYCVGVCAFGAPVLFAVPAVHGAGIGMISAYLYSTFALKGIGYCALLLYPGEVFFSAAMLIGCGVSIEMTGNLMDILSGKTHENNFTVRAYTGKYGVLLAISLASAVLETALYSVFSNYFQFS